MRTLLLMTSIILLMSSGIAHADYTVKSAYKIEDASMIKNIEKFINDNFI